MIRDGASASLDGEWTTSVSTYASSGNETAGGDLNFQFHYLPGDVSRNGQTNPGDVNLLRSLGTIIPNATNFWMDVTGNNQINPGDVNFVRSLGTVILSGAVPTNPPPPRSGNSLMSTFGSKLESEDKLGEKKADNATHRELQLGPSQSPPASLTAATLKPKNRKDIHDQSLLSYMDELDEIPFLLDDFDNILRRPVRRIP